MKEEARKMRASSWGEDEFVWIAMRLWVYVQGKGFGQAEKRRHIKDHLELYEDFKAELLAQLKELALNDILESTDDCTRQPFLHLTGLFYLCGGFQESKSVWLGDRHQGTSVEGIKWDRTAAPRHRAPSPGYSTGLTEPCRALPRKCLFIYEATDDKRMTAFKQLVMLQSIEEEGCPRQKHRAYRVWWLAATMGVQFTRADLDWEDKDCRWGNSWTDAEDLRKWVMKEIAYRTPGAQIPSRLRLARKHFAPTPEERAEIMSVYFKYPEGAKDQAKRWWKLVKERSLSAQDLAEEPDRLRKEVDNDKEWRTNIRRTAGRNHQDSLLLDPRMDWVTKPEPKKLTQVGKLFQTAGLQGHGDWKKH
jgi:hypothetical protein